MAEGKEVLRDRRGERRFMVNWHIRAGHRKGPIKGRVLDISVSGIQFLSPLEYQLGDLVEVEIWLGSLTSIRGVVRIVRVAGAVAEGHLYGAEFQQFKDDGRQVLSDRLLGMLRGELGEEYAPQPWQQRKR